MYGLQKLRPDLLPLVLLFVLPLIWFAPVLLTGKTLLPYDNLYQFEPWQSMKPDVAPHNGLLSDLVLENAVWKLHVRQTLAQRELPLWNPQLFTGAPFFAAGQASVAYPLSAFFYLLPIEAAYGWFTAIQLAIAGMNAYLFARALKLRPVAALFSGVAFQFSGFLVVSVVFTMVIAAASWLPFLLAAIEKVVQKQEEKGNQTFRPVPYIVAGAAAIGLVTLAGHPEFLYYTLLVAGIYTAARLFAAGRRLSQPASHRSLESATGDGPRPARPARPAFLTLARLAGWLLLMPLLGLAAGAVQLLPLLELVQQNFREGSATYGQVIGWAWPDRHILTFFLPDIFGNPSHHHWFDLWALRWQPAALNYLGEARDTIFWGIKNYVEGGNYLGIAAWLLAALAVAASVAQPAASENAQASQGTTGARAPFRLPTILFALLAFVSLLFAFGTPLYALLFFGLPGWDQLHSPFRWVFPFTLAMSVLGGIGLEQALALGAPGKAARFIAFGPVRFQLKWPAGLLALATIAAGLASLLAVGASYFIPAPFVEAAQRIVEASDLAQAAFSDGRMFWGYQSLGLARFGLFAVVSGLGLWLLLRAGASAAASPTRRDNSIRRQSLPVRLVSTLPYAFVAVLALDLFLAHGSFNPAVDTKLSPLKNVPPAVQFINQRENAGSNSEIQYPLFRFTTFDAPGAKTFNANVGMYYGWQDIRGYDSIILKQYVDLMNRVADQSGELLYNRIAPLYASAAPENRGNPFAALEDPLLDLLGVKYILSELVVPNANSWTKIYEDDALRVYENLELLPRAFVAAEAVVLPPAEQPLQDTDLRTTVFIESQPNDPNALIPASPQLAEATISRYTANTVFVDLNLNDRGWLVLTDAYFPGWKAYLRPFASDESDERELTIHRANTAFRAVYLPESGQWTVRFTYSPMSFRLGLYVSFLAIMVSLLLLSWWAWGRYFRPEDEANQARTVAKNSVVPMVLNLANRAIYFVYAMLYVRLLGPEGTGQYAWVVAVYGIFEILSRYGLGTLLNREVAADKNQSSRYLTNVLALRTLLWAASLLLMGVTVGGFWFNNDIGRAELQAIAVFALVMLLSNWSDAFSNLFNAFEKMEYPSGLGIAMALLQAALGALALLLGWGIVGLAWMALLVNLVQLLWLIWIVRSTLFKPEWKWDWTLQREMVATSGPLMINHLLATVFWRMDIWILRPLAGAASAGLYSAALKYVDGLNIVPSTFTLAVFPLMSRLARQQGEALLRSYVLSVRLLLVVSLPIAVTITAFAFPLISILGGARFVAAPYEVQQLPAFACSIVSALLGPTECSGFSVRGGSALALQVIIWSIPVGFVNSVTQYVLIAANQQRYLTKAFVLGVLFNLAGNLLLIPVFGFIGAAVVTIFSELCLLFLFGLRVRRHIGKVAWPDLIWRPAASALAMGLTLYGLSAIGVNVWLSILPAWAVYAGVLSVTGGFADSDLRAAGAALLQNRLGWQMQQGAENAQ